MVRPSCERGDVGGEFGDHGGQVADLAHADEGEFEREVDVGTVADGGEDGALGLVSGSDEADKQVGLCFVGDDVGRAASAD